MVWGGALLLAAWDLWAARREGRAHLELAPFLDWQRVVVLSEARLTLLVHEQQELDCRRVGT